MVKQTSLIREAWHMSGASFLPGDEDLAEGWPLEIYEQLIVDELTKAANGLSTPRKGDGR
jgi:hypothetical protein